MLAEYSCDKEKICLNAAEKYLLHICHGGLGVECFSNRLVFWCT